MTMIPALKLRNYHNYGKVNELTNFRVGNF